jgi:hypothetical protein
MWMRKSYSYPLRFIKAPLPDRRFLRRGSIGHDVPDAQMIILKDLEPALLLDGAVLALRALAGDRFLVAPG